MTTWEDFDPQSDLRRNVQVEMVRQGIRNSTLALHLGVRPQQITQLLAARFSRTWTRGQAQRAAARLGVDATRLIGTSTFPPTDQR